MTSNMIGPLRSVREAVAVDSEAETPTADVDAAVASQG